jgi:hypothetical protein
VTAAIFCCGIDPVRGAARSPGSSDHREWIEGRFSNVDYEKR